ncbi:hypothetical protein FHS32_006511 [Streptomyces albaduncus]|uniref:Response regulatory domain-containing protein n=1 Tax=Streptomyces griseoloalbus TaxID=67303 RepID=A0A7W8BXX5_9ACTN|nr:hypothetical protein [Streptomyces albaduncus]
MPLTVVLAEDSPLMRDGLVGVLTRFGHQVLAAVGDAEATSSRNSSSTSTAADTAASSPSSPASGDDRRRTVVRRGYRAGRTTPGGGDAGLGQCVRPPASREPGYG